LWVVAYDDNPAGRLYTLLEKFGSSPNATIEQAWSAALGVETSELPFQLGRVAMLFDDVRNAYADANEQIYAPILEDLQTLSVCVWPLNHAMGAPSRNVAPDRQAMKYLAGFDAFLHRSNPDGPMPGAADVEDLEQDVHELIKAVTVSEEIDAAVKRLILDRLREVQDALAHMDVGGPDSVRRALESLTLASAHFAPAIEDEETASKIWSTLGKAWRVFKYSAAVAGAAAQLHNGVPVVEHLLDPPAQTSSQTHHQRDTPPSQVAVIEDATVIEDEPLDDTTHGGPADGGDA
jgi:hypothetical protein